MRSAPDIPKAKAAGLTVDIDRLARDGDGWLSAEDRFALKTYGVCTQAQPGVFMIRGRLPGGRLTAAQARGLAVVARRHGLGWIHLTTRQNVELHHVPAIEVPAVLAALTDIGISTRSACGHTMRNVMACPESGVGLDEPFDCFPDARLVSDTILARSATLNCELPSRVNIAFGGCPACVEHSRLHDIAFVSVVRDGRAGYGMWAGGSLGTAPFLAVLLCDFVPREDVVAAAEAAIDVFVAHGDMTNPKKGRMKFAIERLGQDGFRQAFGDAFAAARARPHSAPEAVEVPQRSDLIDLMGRRPDGGWSSGIRPQRQPGRVLATVHIPLGDLDSADLVGLADIARDLADGVLHLTKNQNVALRGVPVSRVAELRRRLARRSLGLEGADAGVDVRACTGSAVCSLAISAAPRAGAALLDRPSLHRNSSLRVHISGCPNSCAQHQAADLGLSGAKVRINGTTRIGYHVWLGADLAAGRLAEVVGRVAEEDVAVAVDAVVGVWEALRHRGETMAGTAVRVGPEAFAAQVAAVADGRFEAGRDEEPAVSDRTLAAAAAR